MHYGRDGAADSVATRNDENTMRILMSLTYYRPNVSGLTIYVERLSAKLVERGHIVTVLTAQHDPALAIEQYIDGVRVVRVPAPFTIGKAPLMPRYADTAYRLAKEHDVVHLHLPQLEASLAAAAGKQAGKPVLLTYHCDLQLPAGLINRGFDAGVYAANYTTGTLADRIVAYTQDYADHSPLLRRFPDKINVIKPPVIQDPPTNDEVAAFEARFELGNGPVLGICIPAGDRKGDRIRHSGVADTARAFSESPGGICRTVQERRRGNGVPREDRADAGAISGSLDVRRNTAGP